MICLSRSSLSATSRGIHFLQIAAKARATLGLALHDAFAGISSVATFPDAECHELVLAGEAELGLLEITGETPAGAEIVETCCAVGPGSCLAFGGARESRIMRRVRGRLLVLRLARIGEAPQPTRQFALPSGRLIHRASGDRRESRHEMMLALLGRMGRTDAAPTMAQLVQQRTSGSAHFRWQALRECLALDSEQGFRALLGLCADHHDPLSVQADALRVQLVQTYPELARLEPLACPA